MLVTSKPCTVMYSEFFSRMVSLTPAPAMMGAAPSPYAPMVMGASLAPLELMTRRPVLTEAPSMVWVANQSLTVSTVAAILALCSSTFVESTG